MSLSIGGVDGIVIAIFILLFLWRRQWAIALASVWAVFSLSPAVLNQIIFSVGTLYLVSASWLISRGDNQRILPEDGLMLTLMVSIASFMVIGELVNTESLAHRLMLVGLLVGLPATIIITIVFDRLITNRTIKLVSLVGLIIIIFIVLKSSLYGVIRSHSPLNIPASWFGFSYIAFRLIHTLRDRQLGRLPTVTLRQYVSYALFFPALTAGPIDQVGRFTADYEHPYRPTGYSHLVEGTYRILQGLIRKFVIANTLAVFALSATNMGNTTGVLWTWIQLYLYSFQIFFDFSGYSDIAIGLGLLVGIKLPENFDRPYTRRNLALFWQSWHMTLSSWVRSYVFLPLSRYLIRKQFLSSVSMQILIAQVVTMLIIGFWHGITINFMIWGLWHGLGLFVHKMWSDATRQWYFKLREHPWQQRCVHMVGIIITFHFVTLGWVWFVLPNVDLACDVYLRLLGLG